MDVHSTHLAVVSGGGDETDDLFDLSRGEFQGTAFPLAPHLGLFLTACHVYDAAAAHGSVAVGRIMTTPKQIVLVDDAERFPDIDLAILSCNGLRADPMPFNFRTLSYLDNVAACGFPFGVTIAANGPHTQILRAFKGNIVTRRELSELGGCPPGYEVSFPAPPGLSGAPLLSLATQEPSVVGVILQQHSAELGDRRMDLGLALDIQAVYSIQSRLAGKAVGQLFDVKPK